jgi:hypothetical protein
MIRPKFTILFFVSPESDRSPCTLYSTMMSFVVSSSPQQPQRTFVGTKATPTHQKGSGDGGTCSRVETPNAPLVYQLSKDLWRRFYWWQGLSLDSGSYTIQWKTDKPRHGARQTSRHRDCHLDSQEVIRNEQLSHAFIHKEIVAHKRSFADCVDHMARIENSWSVCSYKSLDAVNGTLELLLCNIVQLHLCLMMVSKDTKSASSEYFPFIHYCRLRSGFPRR